MRKVAARTRRIRRSQQASEYNGAAWLNTIQFCRPYTDEAIIGSFAPDGGSTVGAAISTAIRVRQAFDGIIKGEVKRDDTEPMNTIAHAIDVSWVRAIQIAGEDFEKNPMLPILRLAIDAVKRLRARWERLNTWGFDGPAISEIRAAIDVYEEILMNSSPSQMVNAEQARQNILKKTKKQQQKALKK